MFALDETVRCSLQAALISEVIADRGCMSEEPCANYFKMSLVSPPIVCPPLFICAMMHFQSDAECNLIACFIAIPELLLCEIGKKKEVGEHPASPLRQVSFRLRGNDLPAS